MVLMQNKLRKIQLLPRLLFGRQKRELRLLRVNNEVFVTKNIWYAAIMLYGLNAVYFIQVCRLRNSYKEV